MRSSLRPVTCRRSGWGEPKLFYCRVLCVCVCGGVNTSTPLHLLVWLQCGLLSSSCPLTGSGGLGAGTCHILWHAHKASRDKQISGDSQKERRCGGKKEAFTLKDGSSRGCYQQLFVASSFPLLLSDGQTYELTAAAAAASSIWGRTNRQGRADQTTANNRITKSSQTAVWMPRHRCHVSCRPTTGIW